MRHRCINVPTLMRVVSEAGRPSSWLGRAVVDPFHRRAFQLQEVLLAKEQEGLKAEIDAAVAARFDRQMDLKVLHLIRDRQLKPVLEKAVTAKRSE